MYAVGWRRLIAALIARSVVHPSLGLDLLRVAWRFRRRQWYRRVPFLPLPDREYVRWRMYTAYGDPEATPPIRDVERYARWIGRAVRLAPPAIRLAPPLPPEGRLDF